MIIKKGNFEYTISEYGEYWSVSYSAGKLTVEYKVPKAECESLEDLEQRILTSDEFGG